MKEKLILEMDSGLVQSVKEYAIKNNKNITEIIENYLVFITGAKIDFDKIYSPLTNSMSGKIKVNEEVDYKSVLAEELSNKYL